MGGGVREGGSYVIRGRHTDARAMVVYMAASHLLSLMSDLVIDIRVSGRQ
jgi:hypothetical protein